MNDFRPISCYSTMHKLVAKVLTTKLKIVAELLVGKSQSTFIKERNILYNVIIAHDLINKYTRKGSSPGVLKVDVRKAYN